MSGILRLANTGAGTGRSTLQSAASNDVTFNLPDTGTDNTATILTSELHSISTVNWDGLNINITNADFNVDNGTLFVDESTGHVGIGTTSPNRPLEVYGNNTDSIIRINNTGDGNKSAIEFFRESSAGTDKGGGAIWVQSDTSQSSTALNFSSVNNASAISAPSKMVLTSDGNVGIGTTDPASRLHVRSTTSDGVLTLQGTNSANAGRATISKLVTDDVLQIRSSEGTGNRAITFSTSTASERMRIDSDGNVSIGTTDIQSRLHVNGGDLLIANPSSDGSNSRRYLKFGKPNAPKVGIGFINTDSNGRGSLIFMNDGANNTDPFDDNDEVMRLTNNGRLGLGTTDPEAILQLGGSSTDGVPTLYLSRGPTVSTTTDIALSANAVIRGEQSIRNVINDNGDFRWLIGGTDNKAGTTGATDVMRIDSSGNVGIRTTDPVELLHVDQGNAIIGQTNGTSTNIRNYLKFGRTTGPKAAIGFVNSGGNGRGSLLFMNDSTASGDEFTDTAEVMRLTNNGRLGLGTTDPKVIAHVSSVGNTTFRIESTGDNTSGRDTRIQLSYENQIGAEIRTVRPNGATDLTGVFQSFRVGGNGVDKEVLRLQADGNVGIGAADPDDKLEIGGNGAGIILASPNGTRYRITVANDGTLTSTAV